ncbi:MAG: prephenate dehydrogenase/arogenate dehydrogenase family protein [Smithellaceae bacterium]|nr:prephenate dehydrogenase/arogenate dehydrogenase family protein [Smithellaceae bacterium]
MAGVQVGIIGGTDGMGKWFADFLGCRGMHVEVAGRIRGLRPVEMAAVCDVVVVSVPIGATLEMIATVGPHMREGQLLMDLTSLKSEPVQAMLAYSCSEVIGCHPLFGPQVEDIKDHNVVLCPARTTKWLTWVRDIFAGSGAHVIEETPERHDLFMAAVQCLNHVNTLTLGLTLEKLGFSIDELDPFATPIFAMKAAIMEKVFRHSPRLYAEIIAGNPHAPEVFASYREALAVLSMAGEAKNSSELEEIIKRSAAALFPPADQK